MALMFLAPKISCSKVKHTYFLCNKYVTLKCFIIKGGGQNSLLRKIGIPCTPGYLFENFWSLLNFVVIKSLGNNRKILNLQSTQSSLCESLFLIYLCRAIAGVSNRGLQIFTFLELNLVI